MGFPWQLSISLSKYLIANRLKRRERAPHVLMLEPTFRCNLSCAGCGRIREYHDVLDRSLSLEDCLDAVHDAAAPVVSITGGEPLIHPDIGEIVARITAEKRFVHLCTNALLLESFIEGFPPSVYLSFVIHIDGMKEVHDSMAGRDGVFETALSAIRAAKEAGHRILINTTVYRRTCVERLDGLFSLLTGLGVDGIMVSPAFQYEAVSEEVSLSRREIADRFKPIREMSGRFPFYNTPIYLDFLAGERELACAAWSTPTRNPKGWKQPCYLLTDGHVSSFQALMTDTPWERYGPGRDPRCDNCMVHCGYEASALDRMGSSLGDLWNMMRWGLSGR